jgi:Rrf2 family protein
VLSHTSDYALRAVLVIAREYQRRPLRADEIAASTGAPRNYLAKTLNALAKAGVLTSARGPQGGFTLAIAPDSLTIAQVIDWRRCMRPCAAMRSSWKVADDHADAPRAARDDHRRRPPRRIELNQQVTGQLQ